MHFNEKNMQFGKSAFFFSYRVIFAPARKSKYKKNSFGSFHLTSVYVLVFEMSSI